MIIDYSPLLISLRTSCLATVIAFFTGIYAAYIVVKMKRFKGLFDAVLTLPLVLPPTVLGFILLFVFGRNSPMGQLLMQLGYSLVFSWEATVLAAVAVAFPLVYRTTRGAFEQIDKNIIYAARTLGVSEWRIFWHIIIPNTKHGIIAGVILAFTRALGEFGATIMIAGNIPGITQTMSTAIYSAVQAGDDKVAVFWVCVIMGFSFVVIMLMNFWLQKSDGRKIQISAGNGA
ncbi:molybdate ABC transporter permease subunit [Pectinatus sottacetonis]|uniref:molybdate ABC transporter permease subunit n=1 Tax=Pectinatus sottacetonis TaxID=1002795 RepID=UPI0018C62A0C|nr:molybdate ABC transporter permease subunit [Pectinatus sottacetonis]